MEVIEVKVPSAECGHVALLLLETPIEKFDLATSNNLQILERHIHSSHFSVGLGGLIAVVETLTEGKHGPLLGRQDGLAAVTFDKNGTELIHQALMQRNLVAEHVFLGSVWMKTATSVEGHLATRDVHTLVSIEIRVDVVSWEIAMQALTEDPGQFTAIAKAELNLTTRTENLSVPLGELRPPANIVPSKSILNRPPKRLALVVVPKT